MSFVSMLNLTCRIRTKVQTQSATTGMPVSTFTNKEGVRCSFQAMSAAESVKAGAERGEILFDVCFEHGTAVTVGDTLDQVGPDLVWADRTFSATSPPIDEAGRGIGYSVTAQETGGGAQR